MGGTTTVGGTEQMTRRHLGLRLGQKEVLRKSADNLQSPGPVEALGGLRKTRPANGELPGQGIPVSEVVRVASKIQEFAPLGSQLETESPPVGQISVHFGKHGLVLFHLLMVGQGRATCRRSSK